MTRERESVTRLNVSPHRHQTRNTTSIILLDYEPALSQTTYTSRDAATHT